MRNLKRVLSLSLASVMLLGMMVIGTSAASDYSDVDYDNDNVEAIEVLEAINVMTGHADANGNLLGTFGPTEDVTRAQMARIMAALMDLDYEYYSGANPFTDMNGHWAEAYAAACYATGIIAGRTNTTYDPEATVTAVEAAAMLMRALGYFQNPAVDYPNGFVISTISQAGKINLFNKVDVKTEEPMTRNDVAQLILNTLQSGTVEPSNSKIDVTVGDAQVSIGSSNYVYVVSRDLAVGNAINTDRADSGNGADGLEGPILDLGEKLYNGELKLASHEVDVFGRPARTWTYKGSEIGTYAKDELLLASYTVAVTGREMYDLLGQSTIREYDLYDYVDGTDNIGTGSHQISGLPGTIDQVNKDLLVRANSKDLGGTGRGVLTEVYLDNELEEITIASINTYLAQANNDYNESSETISLTVYNDGTGISKLVDVEEIPAITGLKKDDWVLVYWADESASEADKVIQSMFDAEIMEDMTVTGFVSSTEDTTNWDVLATAPRRVTEITTNGETYKNNVTAWYKENTLNDYYTDRLVDKTYTIYLDLYGNFIGAELYSGKDQYVFIAGYDSAGSAIGTGTATANAIFTDGTMGNIEVNVLDTNKNIVSKNQRWIGVDDDPNGGYTQWTRNENHEEMWYTYSVRNGIYTLSPVERWTRTFNDTAEDKIINCSNVRLVPTATTYGDYVGYTNNGPANSYGEDDSVYITVSMDTVSYDGARLGANLKGITEIDGVYTGVQNVKLTYKSGDWVHAVYDEDQYIVAAIVYGEAEGIVDNYAYIRGGAKNEKVETDGNGDYIHYWDVEVIMGGELTTKTIRSRYENTTAYLKPGTVQELILDTNGYVTTIRDLDNSMSGLVEVADGAATKANSDKVYTNFDYLNNYLLNTNNGGKPDATDLAEYNVYHLKTHGTLFGIEGIKAPLEYTDLTLQGRTLHYDTGLGDVGLTVTADAKGFIYHIVNNKWKYEDPGSVADAFRLINDASTSRDGLQLKGEVVAVLNSNGVAEWVLFVDQTPPTTKNPGYGTGSSETIVKDGLDITYTYPNGTKAPSIDDVLKEILKEFGWTIDTSRGDAFYKDGDNYKLKINGITYTITVTEAASSTPGEDDPGTTPGGPGEQQPQGPFTASWDEDDTNGKNGAPFYVFGATGELGSNSDELEFDADARIKLDPEEALIAVGVTSGEELEKDEDGYYIVDEDFVVRTAELEGGMYMWVSGYIPMVGTGWMKMTDEGDISRIDLGHKSLIMAREAVEIPTDGKTPEEIDEIIEEALGNDKIVCFVIPIGDDGDKSITWIYSKDAEGEIHVKIDTKGLGLDFTDPSVVDQLISAIVESTEKFYDEDTDIYEDDAPDAGDPGEGDPGEGDGDDETESGLRVSLTVTNGKYTATITAYDADGEKVGTFTRQEIADAVNAAGEAEGEDFGFVGTNITNASAQNEYIDVTLNGVGGSGDKLTVTQVYKITYPGGEIFAPAAGKAVDNVSAGVTALVPSDVNVAKKNQNDATNDDPNSGFLIINVTDLKEKGSFNTLKPLTTTAAEKNAYTEGTLADNKDTVYEAAVYVGGLTSGEVSTDGGGTALLEAYVLDKDGVPQLLAAADRVRVGTEITFTTGSGLDEDAANRSIKLYRRGATSPILTIPVNDDGTIDPTPYTVALGPVVKYTGSNQWGMYFYAELSDATALPVYLNGELLEPNEDGDYIADVPAGHEVVAWRDDSGIVGYASVATGGPIGKTKIEADKLRTENDVLMGVSEDGKQIDLYTAQKWTTQHSAGTDPDQGWGAAIKDSKGEYTDPGVMTWDGSGQKVDRQSYAYILDGSTGETVYIVPHNPGVVLGWADTHEVLAAKPVRVPIGAGTTSDGTTVKPGMWAITISPDNLLTDKSFETLITVAMATSADNIDTAQVKLKTNDDTGTDVTGTGFNSGTTAGEYSVKLDKVYVSPKYKEAIKATAAWADGKKVEVKDLTADKDGNLTMTLVFEEDPTAEASGTVSFDLGQGVKFDVAFKVAASS